MKFSGRIFAFVVLIASITIGQNRNDKPLFWWKFDNAKEVPDLALDDDIEPAMIKESINGGEYVVAGLGKFVPGVKGSAFKFDGFSSYIEGFPDLEGNDDDDEESIRFPREITIEAWISLGAYPWNWAPILTIGKYKITGFI